MTINSDFFTELIRLCGLVQNETGSLVSALRQMDMITASETLKEYKDLFGWKRGGAESFICAAEISVIKNDQHFEKRKYICKAVFSFGSDSKTVLERWVERYKLLSHNGVKIPRIYFYGGGNFIQEYIEYSLESYLLERCKSASEFSSLYNQIFKIAESLDKLQFSPVTFINDIRVSTTGTCFFVDVGEDLGGPNQSNVGCNNSRVQVENYFKGGYNWLSA
jgi:hypothetical protein